MGPAASFLGPLLTVGGGALAQQGMQRTKQAQGVRQAEGQFDAADDAFSGQINALRTELAPFLKGEILPGELAAGEQTKKQDLKMLGRTLGRFGVTGGTGSTSVPAQVSEKISTNVNNQLQGIAANRQERAISTIAQAEAQKGLQLGQLGSQVDQIKGDFRAGQVDSLANLAPFALPSLASGGAAGVSNLFQGQDFFGAGGGLDPAALAQQTSMQQLLQPFGIDPRMFAKPDATRPGQLEPEYETDIFGNKRIKSWKTPKGATVRRVG